MANTKSPTYRLAFQSPYVFSEETNFPKMYTGNRRPFMHINFRDFGKNFLSYYAQKEGSKREVVTFLISPNHIDINCSCFSEAPFFCHHSYAVLWDITFNKKDFFSIFASGNFIELVLKNSKLFHKNQNRGSHFIIPDASLGALYEMNEIKKLPVKNIPHAKNQNNPIPQPKRLAWLMVHSESRAYPTFPVLVPLLENVNKSGDGMKRFGKGFEGIVVDEFKLLDQKRLHSICQDMIANTRKQAECDYADLYNVSDAFVRCFSSWQNTWPLIAREKNIYHFRIGRVRYYLNQKPMPKYVNEITISDEPIQLQFTLKNKGRYYQLSLSFTINGKAISNPEIKGLFFISSEDKCYYMLSSIQDVIFTHWMARHTFTMSAFKENFEAFEKEILFPLKDRYHINNY